MFEVKEIFQEQMTNDDYGCAASTAIILLLCGLGLLLWIVVEITGFKL